MYQCFYCGSCAVTWDCDFSFEDYGEEGDGIYQEFSCMNCGAEITYRISFDQEDDNLKINRDVPVICEEN